MTSPYAVSFYPKNSATSNPITIPVYSYKSSQQPLDGTVAICATTDTSPFHNVDQLLEFLVYYNAVNTNKFWIYSNGISPPVDYLINIAKASQVNVTMINVPYLPMLGALNRLVYFLDCVIRTRDNADMTIHTDLYNFLVPRFHNQLPRMFHDLIDTAHKPPALILMKELFFCLEFPNFKKLVLLPFKFLKKASFSTHLSTGELIVFRPRMLWEGDLTELHVASKAAAVQRYTSCTSPGEDYTYEPAMFKFEQAISSSLFLRRWKFLKWDKL